jgi:hypothetical protein
MLFIKKSGHTMRGKDAMDISGQVEYMIVIPTWQSVYIKESGEWFKR